MKRLAVLAVAATWLAFASVSAMQGTPDRGALRVAQSTPERGALPAPEGAARRAPLQGVPPASDIQKTVATYCITCHNDRLKTGGLALDRPELANVAAHADVWEKV